MVLNQSIHLFFKEFLHDLLSITKIIDPIKSLFTPIRSISYWINLSYYRIQYIFHNEMFSYND